MVPMKASFCSGMKVVRSLLDQSWRLVNRVRQRGTYCEAPPTRMDALVPEMSPIFLSKLKEKSFGADRLPA